MMNPASPVCALMLALSGYAGALPNTVFGEIAASTSPLNGVDLTDAFLAENLWRGSAKLPGKWQEEGRVASMEISHLLATPKLFGHEVLFLRANQRDGKLESIEATYVDAGSYFGYFQEKSTDTLSQRDQRRELERSISSRQSEFSALYSEALMGLREAVASKSGLAIPDRVRIGKTRTLRAELEEWQHGSLTLRLLAADQRLVRLTIQPTELAHQQWIDRSLIPIPVRNRLAALENSIQKDTDGTVVIENLRPIPQGFQPYCGLNTLAMVARHLGMHLDEDWLAVAGGFQNTGSAQGSNMTRLYQSVAAEAGLSLDRKNSLNLAALHRSIDRGLPVIVWRRFSFERNAFHDQFHRQHHREPAAVLPDPHQPDEQAKWPGEKAPLHASVIVGYHSERKEVLFLESWTGRDVPRRMRAEELAATTYLTFTFNP